MEAWIEGAGWFREVARFPITSTCIGPGGTGFVTSRKPALGDGDAQAGAWAWGPATRGLLTMLAPSRDRSSFRGSREEGAGDGAQQAL